MQGPTLEDDASTRSTVASGEDQQNATSDEAQDAGGSTGPPAEDEPSSSAPGSCPPEPSAGEEAATKEDATNVTAAAPEPKAEEPRPSRRSGVPYKTPEWSTTPAVKYRLEVLKAGSIVGDLDLSKKGAYMFGRLDLCDFMLEHPSVSRFHAVVQFGEDDAALLMDLNSAHGTFINKRQVKANVYVPLQVGDVIKFGQSSRLYVFQGPTELMPEEGLSRAQRRVLRAMEAKEAKERAQRDAVMQGRGMASGGGDAGATWGFTEDAEEEVPPDVDEDELTWDKYKGELTEHQRKLQEKLLKRLDKVGHMQKEIDAIEAKEVSQGGLSQGQQAQVARNQQRMQQLMEEAESLEETLNESIREAVAAKSGKTRTQAKARGRGMEEEEDDDSDDEFYDRSTRRKKQKRGTEQETGPQVETASSLLYQQYELKEKVTALDAEVKAEENRVEAARKERETEGKGEGEGSGDGQKGSEGEEDALDAFMSSVKTQLDDDRLRVLNRERSRLNESLSRVQQLLKIADPAGEAATTWHPPKGSAKGSFESWAAQLGAKKKGLSSSESVQKEGEKGGEKGGERLRKTQPAAKMDLRPREKREERSAPAGKEQESHVVPSKSTAAADGRSSEGDEAEGTGEGVEGTADSKVMKHQSLEEAQALVQEEGTGGDLAKDGEPAEEPPAKEVISEAMPPPKFRPKPKALSSEGVERRPESTKAGGGGEREADGGMAREGVRKQRRVLGPARPPGLLSAEEQEEKVDVWVPPQDQSGDGRTSLNAKLGY